MCMYAKYDGSSKVLVAQKPIKVYKYLSPYNPNSGAETKSRRIGYSPIQDKRYTRGQTFTADKFPYAKGERFDSMHSFYNGLHSCASLGHAATWGNTKHVRVMYIPKGALYIRGRNGDILSNKLHWR